MTPEKRDERIPVDRGWAWMVLIGSMLIAAVNAGTEKAYGIFFIEFLRKFKGTVFMTVMINTILNIVYCFCSVFVLTVVIKRLDIRTSVFIGITLCAIGYAISSAATSLEFLLASQSILVGLGIAFYGPPIFLLISDYFDKRKGIANAIFIAGNSLGGLVMPPLYRYLFDEYGLSGGLLLAGAIIFNSLVAAALLRPTSFYTRTMTNRSPNVAQQTVEEVNDATQDKEPSESNNPLHECVKDDDDPNTLYPLLPSEKNSHNAAENSVYIKTPQEYRGSTDDIVDRISRSSIVRYLSNGDIASLSIPSLPGRLQSYSSSEDSDSRKGTYLQKCCTKTYCKLLINGQYLLFVAIYCLGNVGIMCAYIYVPTYARDIGIDDQRIAILVSIISATDFFGRIFCGYLADKPWITPQRIVLLSQVVVGLVLQFTVYYTAYWHLVVFVVLYGSTSGMIAALFPPMMIEIVGKKSYASAIAVFIVFIGLFDGLVLPVLGYLRDITNTYHLTFHVIGASSFVAVILLIIFDVMKRREKDADVKLDAE